MVRVFKGRETFWLLIYISNFSNKKVMGCYNVRQKFHFRDLFAKNYNGELFSLLTFMLDFILLLDLHK